MLGNKATENEKGVRQEDFLNPLLAKFIMDKIIKTVKNWNNRIENYVGKFSLAYIKNQKEIHNERGKSLFNLSKSELYKNIQEIYIRVYDQYFI